MAEQGFMKSNPDQNAHKTNGRVAQGLPWVSRYELPSRGDAGKRIEMN
jgi:hypothetical protein